MSSTFLIESAIASLAFFGCEVTAVNQSDIQSLNTTLTQQCLAPDVGGPGLRRVHQLGSACVNSSDQYQARLELGDVGGEFDPVDPTGTDLGGGRGGNTGAVGTPQPVSGDPFIKMLASPFVVQPGESAFIEWTADNVDRCVAAGGWEGLRDINGSEATDALFEDTTFMLDCDGQDGSTMVTAVVRVFDPNPQPVVSLTATPNEVDFGNASSLSWTATNSDTCTATGGWTGTQPASGSQSTGALSETTTFNLRCTGPGGIGMDSVVVTVDGAPAPPATFTKVTLEQDLAPWGKDLADLDGDGLLDVVVGGGAVSSNVYWYRAPNWQRFQVGSIGGGDDIMAGDINGDGALDIVVNRDPISWYENPVGSGGSPEDPWTNHTIANYRSHDVEIVDMNGDGKADVVIRLAGVTFGTTRVFLQGNTPQDWTTVSLSNDSNGTGGLAVVDIDDDGRPDVVGDGYWLRQPATNITDGGTWTRHTIASWPAGSSIDFADLNGDGNVDVTLAVSEVGVGEMAWFEAPDDPLTQPWIRHVIDTSVEDVHRHHLADMNNDGHLDIVFAEMYQSGTDRVAIYYNDGGAASWTLQVLETHASHNLSVEDIDNDGDMDILGANWQLVAPADGDVYVWVNQIN